MSSNAPTFAHPKIMTIGLSGAISERLEAKGYCVTEASLGQPFEVDSSASLRVLPLIDPMPHDYKEQEIVIVDLNQEEGSEDPAKHREIGQMVDAWWVSNKTGRINPSLLNGAAVKGDFDRILAAGGVFIIFANSVETQEFVYGHLDSFNRVDIAKTFHGHSWNFLTCLADDDYIRVTDDHGVSIKLHEDFPKDSILAQLLVPHLAETRYNCTLHSGYRTKEGWTPILVNKYGATVAAGFTGFGKGTVLIFPDIQDKASFIERLVSELLPGIAPELFPEHENASWTNEATYEVETVTVLRQEIADIERNAKLEVEKLQRQIDIEKDENSYIFDLARETGDALVSAVQKAFQTLGFSKVVDADAVLKEEGKTGQNREDLQIHDYEPTLIVEVKGISNFPSDDNALVVQKYIVLRMKEWGRVNVKGLSVINHQRHLPPLNRDNKKPFRDELVSAADEQDIGLITGWDLHRLVRSFTANGWSHNDVKDIFYRDGRIKITPSHYEQIGVVERYIEKVGVIGVRLTAPLNKGDRLAYELPIVFKEEDCNSLQCENQDVMTAPEGSLAGIKTSLGSDEVEIGLPVYRVKRSN